MLVFFHTLGSYNSMDRVGLGRDCSWNLTPLFTDPCSRKYRHAHYHCCRLNPALVCPSAALTTGQAFLSAAPAALPYSGSWLWLLCRKMSSSNRQSPHLEFHSLEFYISCPPELCLYFSDFLGFCLLLFLLMPSEQISLK